MEGLSARGTEAVGWRRHANLERAIAHARGQLHDVERWFAVPRRALPADAQCACGRDSNLCRSVADHGLTEGQAAAYLERWLGTMTAEQQAAMRARLSQSG